MKTKRTPQEPRYQVSTALKVADYELMHEILNNYDVTVGGLIMEGVKAVVASYPKKKNSVQVVGQSLHSSSLSSSPEEL